MKIQEKIMGFLNMMLYIFFLQCPPFDMIFKLLLISSDDFQYGGNGLVYHMTYHSKKFNGQNYVELYLPARTAVVLKEVKKKK